MFRIHSRAGHFSLYEGGVVELRIDSCFVVSVGRLDRSSLDRACRACGIDHSLPSAVFVASSDAKDVRADRTRHEYAPGFLIKTPTGQPLIAVKGLEREHGIPLIDVETGKASGIETDNLTFFTSWRIVTKVLDKHETVCSFPPDNDNQSSLRQTASPTRPG